MKKYILMLLTIVYAIPCFAQKEANEWHFGRYEGISFKTGTPILIPNSEIIAHEGCAAICDKDGKLLFYTNSDKAWNRQNKVMPYGTDLMGGNANPDVSPDLYYGSSAAQAALIMPHPGKPSQYYIFTAPQIRVPSDADPYYSLYSIVDMEKEGGLGNVITKNFLLPANSSEKQTGTIDYKGTGFWLVMHHNFKNEFYSTHITETGIDKNYVTSQVGQPVPLPNGKLYSEKGYGFYNCMKISPNGKLLVSPAGENPIVELFNFNNKTGEVTNARSIYLGKNVYGVSFSPDNTKLYISVDSYIIQYTVSETATESDIRKSGKVIHTRPNTLYRTLQIGPDKKIYIAAPGFDHLDAINEPNTAGVYVTEKAVVLNDVNRALGLPNFIDNVFNEGKNPLQYSLGFETDTVCPGGLVSFKDSSAIGITTAWKWEFTGGIPTTSTERDPQNIYYAKPGEYPVKLIRYSGYYGTDTIVRSVFISPLPVADAGNDVTVCPGSVTPLGTEAVAGNTYSWTPAAGMDNPAIARPNVTPIAPLTRYFLKVTNEFGCESIDSVDVIIGTISASVTPNTSVCRGMGIMLTAAGGAEYEWSPPDGLSAVTGDSVIASPLTTTEYRVIVSSGECKDTAFVTVQVNVVPRAVAGSDKVICFGESVELGAVSTDPGITFMWTPADGLNNPTISNPVSTVLKTTEYIVEAKNQSGCVARDTVLVSVGNLLNLTATNDTAICTGESIQLQAIADGSGLQFTWTPEAGLSDPNSANPVAKPDQTTVYTVKAFKNGSVCSAEEPVKIEVLKAPVFATKDITLCTGESAELTVTSSESDLQYSWSPQTDLSNPNIQNPIVTATNTQIYTVTAANKPGCATTHTLTLTVGEKLTVSLSSEKEAVDPGETAQVTMVLKAEGVKNDITSFKTSISYDTKVFQLVQNSQKFLKGMDATWSIKARQESNQLVIEANGQTPITEAEIAFELTAFLAKQTDNAIVLKLEEINKEVIRETEQGCRTVETSSDKIVLKAVCAGDMRLVNLGQFQTQLQQITPNPVTADEIQINYSVGIEGNIDLMIYNEQGEMVATLVKGNSNAGVFKELLNTKELAAGVYLCKFTTMQTTQTQMFVIVK